MEICLKKICIFDFDGTLADTMDSIAYFVNLTLADYSLPAINTEIIKSFVGNGAADLIKKSLSYSGSTIPWEDVLKTYMRHYDSNPCHLVTIYDGVIDMLTILKENGYELAVLSNKPHSSTSLIIEKLFPKSIFYQYLGKSDKFKKKPDPEAVNFIADGFDKENSFFIGDSDVDIKTGKNAGMKTIAVTWGFRSREVLAAENPDFIANTASEILKYALN